jgi:epoxyqueuosine reductase
LTIENKGPIPLEMRPLIGNRVYGCDDCQLVCPWNKFSQITRLLDFNPRHNLDNSSLLELFKWDEAQFTAKLQGSPIYRIGYQAWQRNLAVGLGNAPYHPAIIAALSAKLPTASAMVAEHIQWALLSQQQKQATES